ncbi:MAG: histidine--tRNA ligase [bacterium]
MEKKKTGGKRVPPQAPKGMRDIIGKDYYDYQGFYEKSAEIAEYYDFKPIETPVLEDTSLFTSGIGTDTDIVEKEMFSLKTKGGDQLTLRPEGTAGVVRAYIEHGMQSWPQPVMLYYYGPFFRHEKPQRGRFRELRQFGLEILGTEKSIADAIIIKAAVTMFEEAGLKNLSVQINSIGDKSCRGSYRRDLLNYYKKHTSEICKDCKLRIKTNPLRLLDCKDPKCQPVKEKAPQSVSFLCDPCKIHFKEVLEYLEFLGIEYTINNNLVRGLDYYTRTVFEVISKVENTKQNTEKPLEEKTEECVEEEVDTATMKLGLEDDSREFTSLALGGGGRYDYLAKALGNKKDVPAVGFGIGVDRVIMAKGFDPVMPRIIKKPKFFFIQLGFSAKLKSLSIIEILRKAKVGVMHSLSKDSLSSQLATAEKLQIPYAILLGQKEVMDGTVIVRNMDDRSQEEIKLDKLTEYIKKLK